MRPTTHPFNTPLTLRRQFMRAALALTLACAFASPALAQSDYPNKPIRLIVGYPPGGSVDYVGRAMGETLARVLKTSVLIENLGGAAGTIAAQRVIASPADGYTLLIGSSNELAGTGAVNKAQKYDAIKDFTPLGLISTAPVVLAVGPKLAVKNTDELIQLLKKNPGKYSYGSSGVGSSLHFAGELFKQKAGVFMTHIPYRGVSPLTSDLAGGNIEFAVLSVPAIQPFLQSGRLTALAVTSANRLPVLPNVPALAEHPALKGYDLSGWFALMAPRNLPADVNAKLVAALHASLQDTELKRKMVDGGMFIATNKDDLRALMQSDATMYNALVKYANIRE
jgi:tripartite-type tricarboxylate transporter receptor subunit TctC